jgi:hypothetical protein
MTLRERFDAKWLPEPNTGCWLWTASTNNGGYGFIGVNRRVQMAHRVGYELYRGPIPDGMTLDHLCRVTCCVNPCHMEPVSMRANILRGHGVAGKFARRTHCKNGHELSGDNVSSRSDSRARVCVTCHLEGARRSYERRKGKE